MAENSDTDIELARTVLRQGELRLDAQLRLQIAADQRAAALATMLIILATAVISFGALRFVSAGGLVVGIGSLVAGACFVTAAGFAAWTARPGTFAVAGSDPENWWSDGVEERSLAECLRKESGNYQARIDRNHGTMRRLQRSLSKAIIVGGAAPIAGIVSGAITSYWA